MGLSRSSRTDYEQRRERFALVLPLAEQNFALQKRIFFDRAVIKLDLRALSNSGAVYRDVHCRQSDTVPSRHPWLR